MHGGSPGQTLSGMAHTRRPRPITGWLAVLLCLAVASRPASAASGTFDLGQAIEVLKREIAAAEAVGGDARSPFRVDEVRLDFSLVEVGGKAGTRLMVPGADFGADKQDAPKPALRRRVVIDLMAPREPKSAGGAETPAGGAKTPDGKPAFAGGGPLARAVGDLVAAARLVSSADPLFESKRVALDLEFALDRDANGAPTLLVFAGDRWIEPRNVQKLRLTLSAKEK
jgi:hypothetical protein